VQVFNGRGLECRGVVEEIARDSVAIRVGGPVENRTEGKIALTLAQAVLKGDQMDDVVRDAVMLGVTGLVPLVTDRVETDLRRLEKGARLERWHRVAVASAKQCGRAVIPTLAAPTRLVDYLHEAAEDVRVMLVEPEAGCGNAGPERLRGLPAPRSIALLAGPEGGWTPAELRAAASAGYLPLTLGRRTLRADAAALTAIPVLQFLWGDL
jgi:16S rRNA (uracil1498-N3)-methyltransferase